MDALGCVTDVLAVVPEAERNLVVRLIDGPARRQAAEETREYRPLPSVHRGEATVRVRVTGAQGQRYFGDVDLFLMAHYAERAQ